MKPEYDIQEWATETTLGRHVFNANYRMAGNEFRGWELSKTVVMQKAADLTEKVYLWHKKGKPGEQVVRISVAELPDWETAHTRLSDTLRHTMRSDIPRGTAKHAATGDINYVSKAPRSRIVTSMFFTRGNLSVNVTSVGKSPVDVTKMAATLDGLFTKRPEAADIDEGRVEELTPKTLEVKARKTMPVIDHVSDAVADGSWLKIIAPDGELRRRDDTVIYESPRKGRKRLGKYRVLQ